MGFFSRYRQTNLTCKNPSESREFTMPTSIMITKKQRTVRTTEYNISQERPCMAGKPQEEGRQIDGQTEYVRPPSLHAMSIEPCGSQDQGRELGSLYAVQASTELNCSSASTGITSRNRHMQFRFFLLSHTPLSLLLKVDRGGRQIAQQTIKLS